MATGTEWMRDVPANWKIAQVKRYFLVRLGKMLQSRSRGLDDRLVRYLKAKDVQWFEVDVSDSEAMYASADETTRYGVRAGDLLVCEGGEGGRCGIVEHVSDNAPLIIQNALHRLRPRSRLNETKGRNDYLQYVLSAASSTGWFAALNEKATIAHLTKEKLADLRVPVPPVDEQSAIVHFLDHTKERFGHYIRLKESLIELLEEQKQSVIYEAVTGQIDIGTGNPSRSYKSCGTNYLERIPEDWHTVRLGRLALARCDGPFGSNLKSSHYVDQGVRVVRLSNIGNGVFRDEDVAYIDEAHYATLGDHTVHPGDVLVAGLGDGRYPAGRACVAPPHIGFAMVKADCFRFRMNELMIDPEFAAFQLTATAAAAAAVLSTGATRQRTKLESAAKRLVALPPLREQARLVEYCRVVTARFDGAIEVARRMIVRVVEYRTRLIADVVTGKVDVRSVSSGPRLGEDATIDVMSDAARSAPPV